MRRRKVPQRFQGILWSVDIKDLDLGKNRSYVINQILSLGTLEELKWLFKVYPKTVVEEIFVKQPAKIYTPSAFNFCKTSYLT